MFVCACMHVCVRACTCGQLTCCPLFKPVLLNDKDI